MTDAPTANEEEIDFVIASLVAKGLVTIRINEEGQEVISLTDKGHGVGLMLGIIPINSIPDLS